QYDFPKAMFARATVGTSFRYPDAYELFAQDPTCCFGNPNLKPETSTNFNGSIGRRVIAATTAIELKATGFYRRVSDLIADVDAALEKRRSPPTSLPRSGSVAC